MHEAACISSRAGQLTKGEQQRLVEDEQWQRSRFGELETFIFDFLCGGKWVAFRSPANNISLSVCRAKKRQMYAKHSGRGIISIPMQVKRK